jgi:hypothetical protein
MTTLLLTYRDRLRLRRASFSDGRCPTSTFPSLGAICELRECLVLDPCAAMFQVAGNGAVR